MAITYNAGTNTITVTGYTEGTPCTFLDIYNADVAGAWGKVTRQCTNQFCIQAKIVIGDGSTATWFGDSKGQVIFSGIFSSDVWTNIIFAIKANAHFRLGDLISGTRTARGVGILLDGAYRCNFIDGEDNDGAVKLYSCYINCLTHRGCRLDRVRGITIYNFLTPTQVFIYRSSGVDLNNWNIQDTKQFVQGVDGDIDNITLSTSKYPFAIDGAAVADMVVKNVVSQYVDPAGSFLRGYSSGYDGYMINITSDNWTCSWVSYTGKFYRQYEFDLKVIDKDNVGINAATVKIWDKDSNLIVDTTTNASGVIATQTITRGYYNQANGSTLQEASPHLIKIEKAGYTTYEADFTLGDKTDWLIALQAAGGGLMRNPPMTGGMV